MPKDLNETRVEVYALAASAWKHAEWTLNYVNMRPKDRASARLLAEAAAEVAEKAREAAESGARDDGIDAAVRAAEDAAKCAAQCAAIKKELQNGQEHHS